MTNESTNGVEVPVELLTAADKSFILSCYLNRDTLDRPWSALARRIAGKGPATETDERWIANRKWRRLPNGSIAIAE
jgi:hypothetical protein